MDRKGKIYGIRVVCMQGAYTDRIEPQELSECMSAYMMYTPCAYPQGQSPLCGVWSSRLESRLERVGQGFFDPPSPGGEKKMMYTPRTAVRVYAY